MDRYTLRHKEPTKKDFIDTADFDQSEIVDIIRTSRIVREYIKAGGYLNTLYHKTLAMIFEQKSTRTRVSFETAMVQLGGHALNLAPGAIQLGAHETIEDTAVVLGRMCDMIMSRVDRHESIEALAKYAQVPVINGMSDKVHPTQGVGDMITVFDHWPAGKKPNEIKFVFVGDATQVCNTLCDITTKLGFNFVHYGPENHKLADEWLEIGRKNAEKYGGSAVWSEDPEVLKGADFIYTDVWYGLYDKETPKEEYMKDFYPKYQVNDEMMQATENPNCKFMHCLPANRNEEVTDSVLDGPNSAAWDEAENRLTAQRGLVLYFGRVAQEALDEIKLQKEAKDAKKEI
ncbi:ornithine carbamoyltransferase [Candidatus Saccharibacteria bacterium]|nr:ornithine carbamoyltransferase [Candidatus Saccharibacteria bacterium]